MWQLGLAFICIVILSSTVYVISAGMADVKTSAARLELNRARASNQILQPAQWTRFRDVLNTAHTEVPDAAIYLDDLAYLNGVRGVYASRFPFIAQPLLNASIGYYQKSIEAKPMAALTWANLALAEYYLGQHPELIWKNFDFAMRYGGSDPATQIVLLSLSLQDWENLSDKRRLTVKEVFKNAKGPLRKKLTEMVNASPYASQFSD